VAFQAAARCLAIAAQVAAQSACVLCDQLVIDQVFGRNQHFAFAEQQLCAVALEQHPVLGRDEQITLLASDDAGLNPDRGKFVHGRDSALLDPADRLQTVVTGDNQITDFQRCDIAGPLWCGDTRAGGEADDILDL